MTLAVANRVWQTALTLGAGPLVLGPAPIGYRSALAGIGANTHGRFLIDNRGKDEWEICEAYVDSAGILHRVSVEDSSNAGALVGFTDGVKQVYLLVDGEGGGGGGLTELPDMLSASAGIYASGAEDPISRSAGKWLELETDNTNATLRAIDREATSLVGLIIEASTVALKLGGSVVANLTSTVFKPAVASAIALGTTLLPFGALYAGAATLDSVAVTSANAIAWTSRAQLKSPADGIITLLDAAGTSFARVQFGGTTSSYPALKRSAAALLVRLADDSGAADLTAAVITGSSLIGPLTGDVTGNITGNVTGNASTATALATARAINGVNFDGTAAITVTAAAGTLTGGTLAGGVTASSLTSVGTLAALTVGSSVALTWNARSSIASSADGSLTLANNAGTSFSLLLFGGSTSSFPALKRSSATLQARLADDSAYADFTAATITANTGFTGTLTGSLVGNASTATALATARAINGTNFDGTAAITVTAAAGTLTGATLAAGVTASSLTSVGTLASLTVGSSVALTWNARSSIASGADGSLTLANNAGTGFSLLLFGGSTSSFPALKRSSAALVVRLADDSADANLTAATITASTGFTGALTGNASTATALATARAINGVNFDGTAAITVTAAAGTLTGTTLNATVVSSSLTSVGTLSALTVGASVAVTWSARSVITSPSDGTLTFMNNAQNAFTMVQYGGATSSFPALKRSSAALLVRLADDSAYANLTAATITANTGFTGALTGNASTATALATARAINGVNFDGTAAITVTAAAGTLTGATLAAGVTASSLTSVGTLTALVVSSSVAITWSSRSALLSPSDGVLTLSNNAQSGFTRLQFGGTSSSFVALGSSGTALTLLLADNTAGGTMGIGIAATSTSRLTLAASTTAISSLNLPHGAAPTAPVNGDIWTTTAGVFARVNGSTLQLAGGGISGTADVVTSFTFVDGRLTAWTPAP